MSIHIGPASDFDDGRGRKVDVEVTGYSQPIAVFREGERFHAVDDTCTHLHASLSGGSCVEGQVRCWLHKGTFDAESGEAVTYPATGRITVHEVVERDGELYLAVNESRYREHDWEN